MHDALKLNALWINWLMLKFKIFFFSFYEWLPLGLVLQVFCTTTSSQFLLFLSLLMSNKFFFNLFHKFNEISRDFNFFCCLQLLALHRWKADGKLKAKIYCVHESMESGGSRKKIARESERRQQQQHQVLAHISFQVSSYSSWMVSFE